MVGSIAERWRKARGWFGVADRRQLLWRTSEWLMAAAWPFVAYEMVFNRYGWKSEYYNKWGEGWFALALLIPMVAPLAVRLFSGTGLDTQKRMVLGSALLSGVVLAIKFRPHFGGVTFMGFVLPMALYGATAFLWFVWRGKIKKAPPVSEGHKSEGRKRVADLPKAA